MIYKCKASVKARHTRLRRQVYQLKVRLQGFGCASRAAGVAYLFDPIKQRVLADSKSVYYGPPTVRMGPTKKSQRGTILTKCWNPRNTSPCSPTLAWRL